jgi:hypothetical protein
MLHRLLTKDVRQWRFPVPVRNPGAILERRPPPSSKYFGTLRRERTLSTLLHNGPRNEQIKNPEHLSRVVQNASPPIAF